MKRLFSVAVLALGLVPMVLMPLPATAQGDGDAICEQARDTGRYGRYEVHLGTAGGDVLRGGSGDDLLCGFGGNDVLRGGTGNDILVGGKGIDDLTGASGNDTLYIDPFDTRSNGGSGRNQVIMDGPFITIDASMTPTSANGQTTCDLEIVMTISHAEPGTDYFSYLEFTRHGSPDAFGAPSGVPPDGQTFIRTSIYGLDLGDYTTRIELQDLDGNVVATAPNLTCTQ